MSQPKITRRKFLYYMAGGVAAVVVVGTGAYAALKYIVPRSSRTTAPGSSETFVVGTVGPILTMNPMTSDGASHDTQCALQKMFDDILAMDLNLNVKPELAASWSVSSDQKTFTFKLQNNAKWHDGQPVTSDDVAYTINNVIVPEGYDTRLWANLQSVQTPDSQTVVINFSEPMPYLLFDLPYGELYPLPKHLFSTVTDINNNQYNSTPVGNGPFKFVEWVKGDHLTMERNPDYWSPGVPYFGQVIYKEIPNDATRNASLENGSVHYVESTNLPFQEANKLQTTPGFYVEPRASDGVGLWLAVYCNMKGPMTGNLGVRQAMAHCIPQQQILQNVYYNFGLISTGPVPQTVTQFYNPNVTTYGYDINKANSLLDSAGFPRGSDGTRFSLKLYNWNGTLENGFLQVFASELQQAGINLQWTTLDYSAFATQIFTDYNFDLYVLTYTTGLDPYFYSRWYMSKYIQKGGQSLNAEQYSNPQMDQAFNTVFASSDPTAIKNALYQVQVIAANDIPIIPVLHLRAAAAWGTKINNKYVVGEPASDPWTGRNNLAGVSLSNSPPSMTSTTSS